MKKPSTSKWHDNHIQFPRLLSEVRAVLVWAQEQEICRSMDLNPGDLKALFDRAEAEWTRIKNGRKPRRRTP